MGQRYPTPIVTHPYPGYPLIKTETKRRSSGRITLSDVAKAAEVSPITASRALRGERGVTQALALPNCARACRPRCRKPRTV